MCIGVGNAALVWVLKRVVENVREFSTADYPASTVTVVLMFIPFPSNRIHQCCDVC